ncbi:restriction endonuclease subunit S [Tetragenococcus koreensis]|uniref:restriction endonuclease subunit S n=1 Tax=Tetragenococcus koreensis TaxID=290335 RepID=UPI000F50455A|nr:restriction endonuclease subunit S [Tetragenococcus koreensis]AYW44488.1 restriction endonuclease subunit S [Tetragenococcus koreensis]MCF1631260.1 restriction endonuclease subunit S [Tetragenococcus koreensis]GEN90048.1 hypothetical protein TKO01_00940 [Tetragenococcus koreensis]
MTDKKIGTPKLRFPGFTDEWKQRKLKDVIELELKGTAKAKMSGYESVYLETNYLNGGNISYVDSPSNVDKNDVLILWDGSQAGTIYHGFKGALGSTLKAFKPKSSGEFLYQYLKRNQQIIYDNYRTPNIPHVIKTFSDEFSISVPSNKEQQRIGRFFHQLDITIALHQRELEHLKLRKSGLLQKMFPKNGEKFPEVRFPGFTDDWKQCKLGELGTVAMNKRIFKNQTSSEGDVPFYKIGTFGGEPDSFIPRQLFEEYKEKFPYPEVGDILISASGSIGRAIEYTGKDEYFQDSNIVWLKHDNRLENTFLKQFYSIVKWQGLEGSTIKRLYNKNILNTKINVPSIAEQQKIGLFFKQLDDAITLHRRRLHHMKLRKKALLQQMFV